MTLEHHNSQHDVERSPPTVDSQLDATKDELKLSNSPPKETIEQAFSQLSKGSFQLSHAELRKNFRTRLSGDLAKGLWYLLGSVVTLHFSSVIVFSGQSIAPPEAGDRDRSERIHLAISMVSDTAKTLYAVLTPLATAVTGYYFTTGGDVNSGNTAESDSD